MEEGWSSRSTRDRPSGSAAGGGQSTSDGAGSNQPPVPPPTVQSSTQCFGGGSSPSTAGPMKAAEVYGLPKASRSDTGSLERGERIGVDRASPPAAAAAAAAGLWQQLLQGNKGR